VDKEGKPTLHVFYSKFKEGEATVRDAKVSANYGTCYSSCTEIIKFDSNPEV